MGKQPNEPTIPLKVVPPNGDIRVKFGDRQQWVPAGEYKVRVASIDRHSFNGKRAVFHFNFVIVDGPHKDVKMRGFVNANYEAFTAYSKLFQWCTAVMGEEPEPGDGLSLSIFYDKVLRVRVEEKTSRMTKNKFSNVTEILGVDYEL
jgi:hypothetical protein